MSRRRILFIAHAYPPVVGGVESHLWDLAHLLAREGYVVRCLVGGSCATDGGGAVEVVRAPQLTVAHLLSARGGMAGGGLVPSLQRELDGLIARHIEEFRPDLVHLHNAHHFAPELAHCCFAQTERPLLNSIHDRVGEHVYLDVLGLGWAHTLYASDYLRHSLPLPNGPATVLRLGVDLGRFSPQGPPDPRMTAFERPVVFHPSRLLRWKGVAVGLEAFARLREKLGAGTLVLCASRNIVDGAEEVETLRDELARTAERRGIAGHVQFLEFGRDDMPAAYRAASLTWYPTLDEEPLGLAPLEAMASGSPLVVTDSGGMNETVVSEMTGLTVPRNDAERLFQAASRILLDRRLRATLTNQALIRVQEFEIGRYTQALIAVYDDCLARGLAHGGNGDG